MITSNSVLSSEMIETAHSAFESYLESKLLKCLPTAIDRSSGSSALEHFDAIIDKDQKDEAWAAEARTKDEKFGMHVASLTRARDAIRIAEDQIKSAKPETFGATAGTQAVFDLVGGAYDILGPYLGTTVGPLLHCSGYYPVGMIVDCMQRGDSIPDPIKVSRDLAAHWENKYFEDMARLHVLPPDIVTRVSEYVDEIVSFVERIQDNGFAYEGGGSVWFDVTKFEGAEGDGFRHEYAKLQPGSKGNKKLIDEGEGESRLRS